MQRPMSRKIVTGGLAGCLGLRFALCPSQLVRADAASGLPYTARPEEMGFLRPPLGTDSIAVRQCRVEAKSFGKGAAKATCTNPMATRQRVVIPRGYMFLPESIDMQPLITEKDVVFWIEAGQSAVQEFDAFCGFSKGRIPKGPMRASGLQAPAQVLQSQSSVWSWTRRFEQAPAKGGSNSRGTFRSLWSQATFRAAVDEKRVLQQSYGMDAKQQAALKEKLANIDKSAKQPPSSKAAPQKNQPTKASVSAPVSQKAGPPQKAAAPAGAAAHAAAPAPAAAPAAGPVPSPAATTKPLTASSATPPVPRPTRK